MANYLIFNQNGTGLGDAKKILVNREHIKYVSSIAANKFGLKLNSGASLEIQLTANEATTVIDDINSLLKSNPSGDLEIRLPAGVTIDPSGTSVTTGAGAGGSLFDLNDASLYVHPFSDSFQIGNTSTDITDANQLGNIYIQNNDYSSTLASTFAEQANTVIGQEAGGTKFYNATGFNFSTPTGQTALGFWALKNWGNTSNSMDNANGNTALGYQAGSEYRTGNGCTFVGSGAGSSYNPTFGDNVTIIGSFAQASSNTAINEITLGDSSVATLRCAVTSITSLSDERDKKDITDLEYGLDFIESLQPKQFTWDNRPETQTVPEVDENGDIKEVEKEIESANKGKKDFGFIAQDVQALDNDVLRLVYDENPDKLEMSYGKLVPILVKAVKELSDKVKALEAK